MDFALSTEQEAFAESCARFAAAEIGPRWRQADEDAAFPRELLPAAAKAGLLGLAIPEAHGGLGAGILEEVILAEAMSRVNSNLAAAIMLQGNLVPAILCEAGSATLIEEYVRPTLNGERILALAVTEPQAGSDVAAVKTTARRRGENWELSGEKCFITLGHVADALVVLAVVDPALGLDGMSMFVVERAAPGVTANKMDMLANRPIPTSQVFLESVVVPEAKRLDIGFRELMMTFSKERIMVAARWVGHAQQAFDAALEYAKTREQFGKRIGEFQSLAFGFADAALAIESARLVTYRAAWSWDTDQKREEIAKASSYAKLSATRTVKDVTDFALHVGGGWALADGELPLAKLAIDSWVAPVAGGSWEVQRRIIARQLGLRTE